MNRLIALVAVVLTLVLGPNALSAQERPFPLEGFVITATPTPRPIEAVASSVTVLDGDALRARGIGRVQDALAEVGGMEIVQNGSFGSVTSLFMRGAESDHVLVLVDGVQINQPGGAVDLAGLTLDNVERIEVVRGPASALYGSDAVAGVVQIVTRSGSDGARGAISTRVGSYGRREWSAESTGGSERAGYAVSLSRQRADGLLPFNNAHDNTVLSGSLRFTPDERTWSRITLRMGDRSYHFPTDGAGVPVDENAFTFGDETAVSAALGRSVGERLALRALVTVNEFDGGTDDAADGPADTLGFFGFHSLDHVRRSSIDVRATMSGAAHALTLGGEMETQRQRSFTESLSEYGPSADRSVYTRRNAALYGHVSGERSRLSYDVGSRLEDNQRFGTLGTWQVGAALRLSRDGGTRARATAGSAIKEPTFFENFATGFARGNPDLEPERATSWEVGLDHAFAERRVRASATYFSQRLRDLIQYTFATPSPEDPNFFNVAAANARGLELETGVDLGGVTGSVAWTWLRTRVVDAGYDEGSGATFVEGEPLVRRASNMVAAHVAWARSDRVHLSAGARWTGARADRDFTAFPASPVTLEAWTDVTAGAEFALSGGGRSPRLVLTLRGENLLNRDHEEVFGFRAPGRVLLLGVRASVGGS